ncbi:transcriptional regulator, LacI family [Beutenbergia cavernae DSM 12333]|uniref:Transcriptional regulator, LacI family n=1 Tax=Beutenbergia cavernae (strain ATCC BAA-8 / DSM 12333 / CCUG 43141 / JCM 11478 / NBRC 16432 / NCIMB 13614 / HKI 0122) TaxID=471853 RepID=C5C2W9_BEUC1|nr:transcriptional regulator, LacI family [Beutenbergia cavernae DSM 12333]
MTIYDVAERAGVGIATVSRAMRPGGSVSERTRGRVQAAIDELGFRPSHLGTSLASRRHAANGIVFPDLSGPYFAEVILGYEETATRLGRSVLILSTEGRDDPVAAVRDLAARVDGLVLLGRTVPDDVVTQLARSGLPVAFIARPATDGVATVRVDNAGGARELAAHLLERGFTAPRFLGDPDASPDVEERWDALRATLAAGGVHLTLTRAGFSVASGHTAAHQVLGETARPDVLVCANDEVALGAIDAAEELGLTVGRDVAVTGWDDIMAAQFSRPGLTTVRQPMRRLGAVAAELLDERLRDPSTPARSDVLPARLVVRPSTTSAPPGGKP